MDEPKTSRTLSIGKCALCGAILSKRKMTRHLESCVREHEAPEGPAGNDESPGVSLLHLLIDGDREREYWLHLEAEAGSHLKDLDQFLRRIWLECCGHLSAFRINGRDYVSHRAPLRETGGSAMNITVGKVLAPGTTAYHNYDFGTTTTLRLKAIS